MKDRFATPLKLARRELDVVRLVISEEGERLACIEGRQAVLGAMVATEREVVAARATLPPTRWFERTAAERGRLAREQAQAVVALERLRDEAREWLGTVSALEGAAERARAEERRGRERREQAAADDRAAAMWRQA